MITDSSSISQSLLTCNSFRSKDVETKEERVFRFAYNSRGRNKKWNWEDLAAGYEDAKGSVDELLNIVRKGWAIAAGTFGNRRRSKANFAGSQILLLDIDNSSTWKDRDKNPLDEEGRPLKIGSQFVDVDGNPIAKSDGRKAKKIYQHELTWDEAIAHPFLQKYGAFLYTSASHTEEWHRFRIGLILPKFIEDIEVYETLVRSLMDQLPHDPACKDGSRAFYGNTSAKIHRFDSDNCVPADWIEEAIATANKEQEQATEQYKQKQAKAFRAMATATENGWDTDELIQQALLIIPPREPGSGNYGECLTVLQALHSHYGEGAIAIAERWSPSIPGDTWNVEHKVRSFKRSGIKIASLFYIAQQYGYEFPRPEKTVIKKPSIASSGDLEQAEELTEILDEKIPRLTRDFLAVKKLFGDKLRFNELKKYVELFGQPLQSIGRLRILLATEHNVSVSRSNLEDIVDELAAQDSYHPVQEYLDQVAKEYGDSTEILEGIATRYFGADHPIHQTFWVKTLIAAVARIYDPGCQADTAAILNGDQGLGKSQFLSTLAGKPFFSDSLGTKLDRDDKLTLHGAWFNEWGEMEKVLSKRDSSDIKAFITAESDDLRLPYARSNVSLKRRCIIVGSTNSSSFLNDPSGNRRFWIIPVSKKIDIEKLKLERDSIWAAAVALYRSGANWWLSDEEQAIAAEFTSNYETDDPWEFKVRSYLVNRKLNQVTTSELLTEALQVETARQNRGHGMRVASILRRIGWSDSRKQINGIRQRVWIMPEAIEAQKVGQDIKKDKNTGCQTLQVENPPAQPSQPAQPSLEVGQEVGQAQNDLPVNVSQVLPNLPNQNEQKKVFSSNQLVEILELFARDKDGYNRRLFEMSPLELEVLYSELPELRQPTSEVSRYGV
ncbi:MAG: virulence-associated E family protein [Cyanobacteria bacterium P01_F01_bin.150]